MTKEEFEKIRQLANRYDKVLAEMGVEKKLNPVGGTDLPHLRCMLEEISDISARMSLTKRHRWLGFIQGVLCSHDIIFVTTERDATRDILRGD